jgi:hypothetical protein
MDLSHVFSLKRWRLRFQSEQTVRQSAAVDQRTPDATVDEVGAPQDNIGFTGRPLRSRTGNGQGSNNPLANGFTANA